MSLQKYIMGHTERNACQCGQCIDKGQDFALSGHTVNMVFFEVAAKGEPTKEALTALLKEHKGEFCDVNLFDGKEHSYIEIGGFVGDQGLALQLMGLGSLLKMWDLLTPFTLLGSDFPKDLATQMAGSGLVSIQAESEAP